MSRTHLAFRNFKPEVTLATAELFDAKPWSLDSDTEKENLAQSFAERIVAAYDAPPVAIFINPEERDEIGYEQAVPEIDLDEDDYDYEAPRPAQIVLDHWSIVQLLIHLREHILTTEAAAPIGNPDEDPIKWATSLFYLIKPVMFRARAREGRMPGVTAKDTYTAESWEKLVEAGYAYDGRLTGEPAQWRAVIEATPDALSDTEVLSDSIPDELEDDQPSARITPIGGWDDLTRDEVRSLAVRYGVPRGSMNKSQLIQALQNAGVTL